MIRCALLTLALVASSPRAGAQGAIRGVLTDSLITGRPVPNAEVVLLGAGRKVATDADGRFDFESLPAGRYTIAFWAPWLDSLGLPPLQRDVDVIAGRSSISLLGTPSPASYQLAVCGTALDREQGVLIGEVRDTSGLPVAGVGVNARWTETIIGQGRLDRQVVASVDTTDGLGLYALCGVPVGSEVALRAIGAERTISGEIIIAIGAPVVRRDLAIAPPGAVARVQGRVVGLAGEPIPGAAIAIAGDTARVARADAQGRFVLDSVPRRSTQLIARALGFVPFLANVELVDESVDVDEIPLERVPPELEAVVVRGEAMPVSRLAFEQRKSANTGGRFIGDVELARIPVVTVGAIVGMVQRASRGPVVPGGEPPDFRLERNGAPCRPLFFVDGFREGVLTGSEQEDRFRRAKRIEIYRAAFAPPQFTDFEGCGAVVIWTR